MWTPCVSSTHYLPFPLFSYWFQPACGHAQSLQLSLTLCELMDCSPPGSSCPWDSPGKNTEVGCHALLQGIFPTQEWNPCLLHCRQILYTYWGTWEALVPFYCMPFILCTVCLTSLGYKLHVIRDFLLYCSQLCPVSPNSADYMPSKSV